MMITRALGGTRHLLAAMAAALSAALPLAHAAAQSAQQPSKDVVAARVDSMVQAYMAEKGPASMSVAISRGSETLVQRAWGVAEIATKRPATAASIYKIGSVSKQFTAVLLLKQVERGKLALTDSIGRYLTTGLRPEWRPLTIEQLLNHTAGLQPDYKREGRPEDEVPADTLIAWAARDTMLFAPGTSFSYSNPGYLLLGALVEKLYGKPYGEALHEEIGGAFEYFTEKEAIVRLEEEGIANARLRTVRQFLDHPQLKARGCWREVEAPAGPLWALLPPATPAGVEPIMASIPGVGEHTGEILEGLEREERPESLDEVRKSIDAVDREIVRLLGEREGYVRQATRFKKTQREVEAKERVEEVVGKVRALAEKHEASPEVVEEVYRAMISRFISLEMDEHARDLG